MYAPRKTWNLAAQRICRQRCGFSWHATEATRTRGCCRRVPPRKSAGGCLNTACTSDVVASQTSMHCAVMSLLFCSLSSSLTASYSFSPHGPCPFHANWQTFFLAYLPCSVGSGSTPPTVSRSVPSPPLPVPPEMLIRLLCSELLGPPHGPLPATSWLRRPRPVPDPVLCVPPPSGWNGASPRGLAGSRDFALVVDDGSTQLARISLPCTICPGLDQQVVTSLRRILSLTA